MNEKDLNRIIVRSFNSLNEISIAHKISDEAMQYTSTAKKPFDYFGACGSYLIYGESKFQRGYQSFNFNRLQDHQIKALLRFRKAASAIDNSKIFSVVSLGIWESRKYFHVYFFDIDLIVQLQDKGITSLKKKYLDILRENGLYYNVKNKEIRTLSTLPVTVSQISNMVKMITNIKQ